MQKRAEIPNKPRFSLATQRAYSLLAELDIGEFPVDPRKIIKHFPSWHLVGWLELQQNTDEEDPLHLDKEKAEAKTVKVRGNDDYLIVYDERVDNSQRIRWTLAHEIGHIVMGHLVDFGATALNRRGLTKDEYGVLEVEAHWFASDLLAPKTIIRRFDFNDDEQGIALICDISKDAAERRLKEIKRTDFGYYSTENRILRNFHKHLFSGGFYDAIHETACKFYPSVIFPDMCKEARVCRNCFNFVVEAQYTHCTMCGKPVPTPEAYNPINLGKRESGKFFFVGWPTNIKGKLYYELPLDQNERLGFCPICRSVDSIEGKEQCEVCGTPVSNHCIAENKVLNTASRYCPDCGSGTTFRAIYDSLPERLAAEKIRIPADLDDYIECEYWSFIVMTIGFWEKDRELYAALEDSIAFYDNEDMVIFVRGDREAGRAQNGKETILLCLSKYGELPVKRLNVIVAEMAA